jgi:hypothetical protein
MSPYFVDENVYLVTFFGKNGATPKNLHLDFIFLFAWLKVG